MSRTTRSFSQLDSESDTNTSPTGVFANARSSHCSPDFHGTTRVLKRRKTGGLNARFDRMLEDMTLCQQKPTRRRARSSGSSSVSSYDIPKTPIDAYNQLSAGACRKQHADVKPRHPSPSADLVLSKTAGLSLRGHPRDVPLIVQAGDTQVESLPAWLSSTIMTLDTHHPLRLLLPPSPPRFDGATASVLDAGNMEDMVPHDPATLLPEETSIFAFCPDLQLSNTTADLSYDHEADIQGQISLGPSLMPRRSPSVDELRFSQILPTNARHTMDFTSLPVDALQLQDPLPFSTPGPCHSSHLSLSRSVSPAITSPTHSSSLVFPTDKPFHSSNNVIPDGSDSREFSTLEQHNYTSSNDTAQGTPALDLITRIFSVSNPVPFSTPGPAHTVTYLDSPAEDLLTDFDAVPASELDYDALDFHWEPFDRKGTSSSF